MPDVIGVGHLCMDRIAFLPHFPEENRSVRISSYIEMPGGTVSGALVQLSKLGIDTAFLSPVGDDESGRKLLDDMKSYGVDMSLCDIQSGKHSHFTNVMVNSENQSRTFQSFHSDFVSLPLNSDRKQYIRNAKILHLDNTRNEDALAAAKYAKKHNIPVSLDGSSISGDTEGLLKLVDILVCSEVFPERITGVNGLEASMLELFKRFHPGIFVSTLGEKGSVILEGNETDYRFLYVPSCEVKAVDTTGAGDAYHGGFLYGLLKKKSFLECMRYGSACGAFCTLSPGRSSLADARQMEEMMKKGI